MPRATMSSTAVVAATAMALAVLLSGCGGGPADDGDGRPDFSDTPAEASSSPAESAAPSAPGATGDEPVDGKLLLGSSTAETPEQQAVAAAWFSYWVEVNRMYRDGSADPDTLYRYAKDEAATGPLGYLEQIVGRGERQVGGNIAAVSAVRIDGDRAEVDSCFRNSAINVDADGRPVEVLVPFFTTREVLRQEGPDWRVETTTVTSKNERCSFR